MIWLPESILLKWKHEKEALTVETLQNFYDNFDKFFHSSFKISNLKSFVHLLLLMMFLIKNTISWLLVYISLLLYYIEYFSCL